MLILWVDRRERKPGEHRAPFSPPAGSTLSKNTDVKEKEDKSQEDEKDKIDDGGIGKAVREATTGRGGRLLVRGGFWEMQVTFGSISFW